MLKNIKNRSYSISKKPGKLWRATCYDSYGKYSKNYFETEDEANKWIYWRWDNEEWFNSVDSQDLLNKAIAECVEIDKANGLTPSLD